MDCKTFNQLYVGNFDLSERELRILALAKEYHDTCERYDELVCSGRSKYDHCAMPIDAIELRAVNTNSRKVFTSLCEQNRDIDPKELRKAIKTSNTWG